jgi:hypothetical protein
LLRKPRRSLISLRMARAIPLLAGELVLERREPVERVADGAAGGHGDVLAGDLDGERLGAEAGAVAGLAGAADWYLASSSRIQALSVWSMRRLRLPITPSNGFLTS